MLICQDPTMRWSGQEYINHPDHRAAGEACLDAVYPSARDPLTFPELLLEGLQPHKVREVYLTMATTPDRWIDISATLDRKLAALREHRSQIGEGVEDIVRRLATAAAEGQDGFKYAESYKYFNLR
jgi:LmbE family N-acetylglucosaminyl deacetylase